MSFVSEHEAVFVTSEMRKNRTINDNDHAVHITISSELS